jgi:hypothetical protein
MEYEKFCEKPGQLQAFYIAAYEAFNKIEALNAKKQQKAFDKSNRA